MTLTFDPLPDPEFGDHLTIAEFKDWVRQGVVNDWDGSSCYATETQVSNHMALCEHIAGGAVPPPWATHVVWYAK